MLLEPCHETLLAVDNPHHNCMLFALELTVAISGNWPLPDLVAVQPDHELLLPVTTGLCQEMIAV